MLKPTALWSGCNLLTLKPVPVSWITWTASAYCAPLNKVLNVSYYVYYSSNNAPPSSRLYSSGEIRQTLWTPGTLFLGTLICNHHTQRYIVATIPIWPLYGCLYVVFVFIPFWYYLLKTVLAPAFFSSFKPNWMH